MKDFVEYQEALVLKELGFDEPCLSYFSAHQQLNLCGFENMSDRGFVSAPTYSQCFRWFRKKHNLDGMTYKSIEGSYYHWITKVGDNRNNQYEFYNKSIIYYKTYEEAEQACLIRLIEIVKEKQK
jgi:hypothetical protein